jgi:programmed cell death 8 (apoptosis-inducing factor)
MPVLGLSSFCGAVYWAEQEEKKDEAPPPPHFDFVLIGGGIASYMAAREIRSKAKEATVLLIGDELYSPYLRPPLSKNLWRATSEEAEQLTFPSADGSLMGVWASGEITDTGMKDLVTSHVVGHVRSIDVPSHIVQLDNESEFSFGKVLIATGSRAVSLTHVEHAVADRVFTLRTLDDWFETIFLFFFFFFL